MRKIDCEHCPVRGRDIIQDLQPGQVADFRSYAVTAIYKARQVIFHEGAPADGLYILCHGAVKLYQSDRFGRDYILTMAGPGEVLGEFPMDPRAACSVSAEAVVDSQLCYLPRGRLVPFIQAHPMTGVRLIGALSMSLSAARRKARALALKKAESRLAEMLIQLSRGGGKPAGSRAARILPGYSRREIGEMIGVSTETAIRLLGRLKRKRLIAVRRRELTIANAEGLARLARLEPPEAS